MSGHIQDVLILEDAYEALYEIELHGFSPGEAIRHQNDLIIDLLNSLEALTADSFPRFTGGYVGTFDIKSGDYEKALAAIARAKGDL